MSLPKTATDLKRPSYGSPVLLLRAASVLLIATLFYFAWYSYNETEGYPDLTGLEAKFYPLLGAVGFLVLYAAYRFISQPNTSIDRRLNLRIAASLGLGLAVTTSVSLVPFAQMAFGYSFYGFPLTSTAVACGEVTGACHLQSSLTGFLVDYVFDFLLVYPLVRLLDSAISRKLMDEVSMGVWVTTGLTLLALFSLVGVATLAPTAMEFISDIAGSASIIFLCFLPNILLCVIAFKMKARKLGFSIIATSMILLAFLAPGL